MSFNGGPIPVTPATGSRNLKAHRYMTEDNARVATGGQDRRLGNGSPLRVPRVRNHAQQLDGAQEEGQSALRATGTATSLRNDDPTTQTQKTALPIGSTTTSPVSVVQDQSKLHRRIGTPNPPRPRSSLPKGFDPFPRSPPKAINASTVKVEADAQKDKTIHPSPVETNKEDNQTVTQAHSDGNASPKTPPSGEAKPAADEATTPVAGKRALNPASEPFFSSKLATEPKKVPVEIITTAASPERLGDSTSVATTGLQDIGAQSRNTSYHTAKTHQSSSSPESSSPPTLSTAAINNCSTTKPKSRSSPSSTSDDIPKPRSCDSSFATDKLPGDSSREASSRQSSSSDKQSTTQLRLGDRHERTPSGGSAKSTESKKSTKSTGEAVVSPPPPGSKTEAVEEAKNKKNAASTGSGSSSSSNSSPRATTAVKRASGEYGREGRTYAQPHGRKGESGQKERSPPAFDMQNFPALPMARADGAGANGAPKGG